VTTTRARTLRARVSRRDTVMTRTPLHNDTMTA
jgi:hypothetical protein